MRITALSMMALIIAVTVGLVPATLALAADTPTTSEAAKSSCDTCHTQELDKTLPSGEKLSLRVDPAVLKSSVHGQLQCTSCHRSIEGFPHTENNASTIREYRVSQKDACTGCHAVVYTEMNGSVHAALGDKVLCTDCHRPHESEILPTRVESVAQCSNCHDDAALMRGYGVSTDVVRTYLHDYHGKTLVLAAKQSTAAPIAEAVCTDCHGTHNIVRTDGTNRAILQSNMADTCRKCHPGAGDSFVSAWLSHNEPSLDKAPLVFFADWFYRLLIPFVVVGLLIHIILDFRRLPKQKEAVRDGND